MYNLHGLWVDGRFIAAATNKKLPCMLQLESSFAPVADVVLRGHSCSTREGRGLVTFAVAACCTGISFTGIVQALRLHNHLEKTD